MKIYGLLGYRLSHSFSRTFFNEKFIKENILAEYRNFELDSIEEITSIIDKDSNICGLNVTIPYKERVIPYLDEIDTTAQAIGAVNVIKIIRTQNGTKLKGYNSDTIGFTDSLRPLLTNTQPGKALVLGTGGASKAVLYGLHCLGIETIIVSRQRKENAICYEDLSPELINECTIIVNATPLGMYPNIDDCPPIPYRYITNRHIAYDLTYNPEITRFMKECAQKGAVIKNGLEMLHKQALAAWEIWNK